MKTHPISFLSGFIAAIAVPVLVNAASLSRSLLSDRAEITKHKGMVVLPETAKSNPKARPNVDSNGVILHGYDPVAYFTLHRAVKGNSSITSSYGGAIYHFASAADKAAFDKNPSRYVPQYGGFCADYMRRRKLVDIDPTAFLIHKDKLYVCYSADYLKEFRSNIDRSIREANEQWASHDRAVW